MRLNPPEPLRRLYRFYFPSVDFDLPLAFKRTQAVSRLSEVVVSGWRALFWPPREDAIGGKVSRTGVSLYHIELMHGRPGMYFVNSWRPMLFARFRMRGDTLHLEGKFTVHPSMQVFTGIWLLLAYFITGYIFLLFFFAPAFGMDEPMPLSFPLGALALVGGVTWLVRKCWQTSEDDIELISQFLREQVGDQANGDPL